MVLGKYELTIFWSKEDEPYLVEAPELPGCIADDKTYEEAVKNARWLSQNGLKLFKT